MANTQIDSADYTNFSAKDYEDTAAYQDAVKYPSSYSVEAGEEQEKYSKRIYIQMPL